MKAQGGLDATVAEVTGTTTGAPQRAAPKPAVKPVRATVVLKPGEHYRLQQACLGYAKALAIPTVAAAEVIRVLLELRDQDPQLAARVGEALAASGGNRRRSWNDPARKSG